MSDRMWGTDACSCYTCRLHRAHQGRDLPENARTSHRHGVRWGLNDIARHKPAWILIGLVVLTSILMVVVAVLAQKAPVP